MSKHLSGKDLKTSQQARQKFKAVQKKNVQKYEEKDIKKFLIDLQKERDSKKVITDVFQYFQSVESFSDIVADAREAFQERQSVWDIMTQSLKNADRAKDLALSIKTAAKEAEKIATKKTKSSKSTKNQVAAASFDATSLVRLFSAMILTSMVRGETPTSSENSLSLTSSTPDLSIAELGSLDFTTTTQARPEPSASNYQVGNHHEETRRITSKELSRKEFRAAQAANPALELKGTYAERQYEKRQTREENLIKTVEKIKRNQTQFNLLRATPRPTPVKLVPTPSTFESSSNSPSTPAPFLSSSESPFSPPTPTPTFVGTPVPSTPQFTQINTLPFENTNSSNFGNQTSANNSTDTEITDAPFASTNAPFLSSTNSPFTAPSPAPSSEPTVMQSTPQFTRIDDASSSNFTNSSGFGNFTRADNFTDTGNLTDSGGAIDPATTEEPTPAPTSSPFASTDSPSTSAPFLSSTRSPFIAPSPAPNSESTPAPSIPQFTQIGTLPFENANRSSSGLGNFTRSDNSTNTGNLTDSGGDVDPATTEEPTPVPTPSPLASSNSPSSSPTDESFAPTSSPFASTDSPSTSAPFLSSTRSPFIAPSTAPTSESTPAPSTPQFTQIGTLPFENANRSSSGLGNFTRSDNFTDTGNLTDSGGTIDPATTEEPTPAPTPSPFASSNSPSSSPTDESFAPTSSPFASTDSPSTTAPFLSTSDETLTPTSAPITLTPSISWTEDFAKNQTLNISIPLNETNSTESFTATVYPTSAPLTATSTTLPTIRFTSSNPTPYPTQLPTRIPSGFLTFYPSSSLPSALPTSKYPTSTSPTSSLIIVFTPTLPDGTASPTSVVTTISPTGQTTTTTILTSLIPTLTSLVPTSFPTDSTNPPITATLVPSTSGTSASLVPTSPMPSWLPTFFSAAPSTLFPSTNQPSSSSPTSKFPTTFLSLAPSANPIFESPAPSANTPTPENTVGTPSPTLDENGQVVTAVEVEKKATDLTPLWIVLATLGCCGIICCTSYLIHRQRKKNPITPEPDPENPDEVEMEQAAEEPQVAAMPEEQHDAALLIEPALIALEPNDNNIAEGSDHDKEKKSSKPLSRSSNPQTSRTPTPLFAAMRTPTVTPFPLFETLADNQTPPAEQVFSIEEEQYTVQEPEARQITIGLAKDASNKPPVDPRLKAEFTEQKYPDLSPPTTPPLQPKINITRAEIPPISLPAIAPSISPKRKLLLLPIDHAQKMVTNPELATTEAKLTAAKNLKEEARGAENHQALNYIIAELEAEKQNLLIIPKPSAPAAIPHNQIAPQPSVDTSLETEAALDMMIKLNCFSPEDAAILKKFFTELLIDREAKEAAERQRTQKIKSGQIAPQPLVLPQSQLSVADYDAGISAMKDAWSKVDLTPETQRALWRIVVELEAKKLLRQAEQQVRRPVPPRPLPARQTIVVDHVAEADNHVNFQTPIKRKEEKQFNPALWTNAIQAAENLARSFGDESAAQEINDLLPTGAISSTEEVGALMNDANNALGIIKGFIATADDSFTGQLLNTADRKEKAILLQQAMDEILAGGNAGNALSTLAAGTRRAKLTHKVNYTETITPQSSGNDIAEGLFCAIEDVGNEIIGVEAALESSAPRRALAPSILDLPHNTPLKPQSKAMARPTINFFSLAEESDDDSPQKPSRPQPPAAAPEPENYRRVVVIPAASANYDSGLISSLKQSVNTFGVNVTLEKTYSQMIEKISPLFSHMPQSAASSSYSFPDVTLKQASNLISVAQAMERVEHEEIRNHDKETSEVTRRLEELKNNLRDDKSRPIKARGLFSALQQSAKDIDSAKAAKFEQDKLRHHG